MNMVLDNNAETFAQIQRKKKTFPQSNRVSLCPALNQSEEEASPSQKDERGEGTSFQHRSCPCAVGGDTSDDPQRHHHATLSSTTPWLTFLDTRSTSVAQSSSVTFGSIGLLWYVTSALPTKNPQSFFSCLKMEGLKQTRKALLQAMGNACGDIDIDAIQGRS